MNAASPATGPLRVGIVGMGVGAQVHLPAFLATAGLSVAGLADGGSGRARTVAAELASPPRVYESAAALIRDDDIDLVSLAVPPALQVELTDLALTNGKRVLCEKPVGLSTAAAHQLMLKAQTLQASVAIAYQFRFETGIRALRDILVAGKIGAAERISVVWHTAGGLNPDRPWSWHDSEQSSTGILGEFCSHVFDYAALLMDAPISSVSCRLTHAVASRPTAQGGGGPVSTADGCVVTCAFANGGTGHFDVSNAASDASGHRIEITGATGFARFRIGPPYNEEDAHVIFGNADGEVEVSLAQESGGFAKTDSRIRALGRLLAAFINDCRDTVPDLAAAVAVHRIIEAALQSARSGNVVTVNAGRAS